MADETLRGWNAIADFLACDVRTAKRWEQYRHLPVHRIRRTPGEGRPNVYALKSEMEAWLASANVSTELPPLPESPQQPESRQYNDVRAESEVTTEVFPAPARSNITPQRWKKPALALACLTLPVIALIAWRLAESKIAAHSTPAKATRPVLAATAVNAHTQELYLDGSYLFEQRTPETLEQAKLDFQAAIAASPNYAPAYAGLAKTYALLREYSTLPSAQAYPLVRQAAQQAIALDPRLADAHTALGYEEFFWEWDAQHAEAEFKKAIALDPKSALPHHWYGSMLTHQTRFADAIDQLNQAQMLDPDSAGILGSRAYAIGLSGKRDQAINLVQDILTRVPDSAPLHFTLAQLCLQEPRDIPRYLDQMRRAAELRHSREELAILNVAEPAYRNYGEPRMWKAMLEVERGLHPDPQHPTYLTAEFESALGMKDSALRDLTILVRDHDEQMIGIEIDATLFPLQGDPRFSQLASQIGLPHPTTPSTTLALSQ